MQDNRIQSPPGSSLTGLINGFLLTQRTEGKSPKTLDYYEGILRRFLWFADREVWPDDVSQLDIWHVRSFLGYVGSESNRWGLRGNGAESSSRKASPRTVHHYFAVLRAFFNWAVREGFLSESPAARVKIAKPTAKVIQTFSRQDIENMLKVCEWDFQHGAKFLGSRNRALILVLFDTGMRASELLATTFRDLDADRGWIRAMGKGARERVVRVGSAAQKAIWKYFMHRPDNGLPYIWLTEEGRPLQLSGLQSLMDRLKDRAGIRGVTCSPHTFRHTFAVSDLRNGGNVFELQYLLGHSSLEMVKRYVSTLGMMDALEGHARFSPADNIGLR